MHNVLREIGEERERQIEKGYTPISDGNKPIEAFCVDIHNYNAWASQMALMQSPSKARKRLIQVAALAMAAVERIDREL